MGKEEYIRRAEQVLAEAKRQEHQGVGQCRDCRWFSFFQNMLLGASCQNPIVELAAQNQHEEYDRSRMRRHGYQRGTWQGYGPVLCGPDGALFEP